jgi:hypothetical protein
LHPYSQPDQEKGIISPHQTGIQKTRAVNISEHAAAYFAMPYGLEYIKKKKAKIAADTRSKSAEH